jgi:two-component sensor histidine kinase
MSQTFKLLVFFILFSFTANSKQAYDEIEKLILNEENSKALQLIEKVSPTFYTKTLRRIALNEAGYLDYIEFIKRTNIYRKFEYEQLNALVQKKVLPPKNIENINLNYVKVKWYQINNLRNEISLTKATEENEKLKLYVSKIGKQKDPNVYRAKIYINTHDIVMSGISNDLKTYKKLCEKDLRSAEELKDTFLIITAKYFYNDYFASTRQVQPYIQNCKDILSLDEKINHSSGYYYSTIDQLLDVYFYTGEYDKVEVEELLNKINDESETRYYSYSFFAKYIGTLEKNDSSINRILKQFNQPNLLSFFQFIVKDSKGKMNNNQLVFLYKESSTALYKHGYFAESINYISESCNLIKKIYSQDLAESLASYKTREIKKNKELEIKREKEKTQFYITFSGVIAGLLILLTFLLINNRKKSIKLEEKNKENELLIKEIHHRVKNNFQTISSLIELQGKNIEDEKTLIRLNEGQSRIKSMSLIHQKLYQNDSISAIDFEEYSIQLTTQILNLYGLPKVKLTTQLKGLVLDVDTAIPLGLILNELVTNSCKYAFSENKTGNISMAIFTAKDGEYIFEYRDNGPGIPPDFDFKKTKSLGLRLIQRLVKQLRGTFNYRYENLSIFEIKFKDTLSRKNDD